MLLVGHMRSQSSLLAHILASHPDVAGHSELHRLYQTRADLVAMRAAIEDRLGGRTTARWLVDKVLHDRFPIELPIAARRDVRVIALLRRPRAAIASITRVSREHAPGNPGNDPALTAGYYVDRLRTVVAIAEAAAQRVCFVRSEDLVDTPGRVLDGLTRFLALDPPLAPTYRTFANTGMVGKGDPSEYIKAGRVLRDHERPDAARDAIEVPDAALARAQAAYDEAVARLARWAV